MRKSEKMLTRSRGSLLTFRNQPKPIRDEVIIQFSGNITQFQARPDSKRLVLLRLIEIVFRTYIQVKAYN